MGITVFGGTITISIRDSSGTEILETSGGAIVDFLGITTVLDRVGGVVIIALPKD